MLDFNRAAENRIPFNKIYKIKPHLTLIMYVKETPDR